MKIDPTHKSEGVGKENMQHFANLLTRDRGTKKVLKNAVLKGIISARMPVKVILVNSINESSNIPRIVHNNRKYPALAVQVDSRVRYRG